MLGPEIFRHLLQPGFGPLELPFGLNEFRLRPLHQSGGAGSILGRGAFHPLRLPFQRLVDVHEVQELGLLF